MDTPTRIFMVLFTLFLVSVPLGVTALAVTTQHLGIVIWAGAGFFVCSAILSIWFLKHFTTCFTQLHRSIEQLSNERDRSQAALKKIQDELEIRVDERTAALKKKIEDLALAEEKYRKVTDASPVPIAVFAMDGTPLYINPAFTHTFGWTLDEFVLEKDTYIPRQEYDLNMEIRRKIVRGQGGQGIETRRYNKAGKLLDVIISFDVWRGQDSTLTGCVVIFHDVTQKKQLERQLFQSQKMEAMGTLAGGIAHDFNNILSGIFAFTQLADKYAGDAEKARNHIQQIVKGAQRAASLVQQILTFCRQSDYQKQSLNLDIIVKEALKLLHSTLPPQITLVEDIAAQIIVMADPTQIHQVVMNLCTNAYHAMMNDQGVLTVRLYHLEISPRDTPPDRQIKPGKYACLEVLDTGHGMSPDVLEKAFDPYFTTKEIGKGTGVGLALVKAIVEAHDGYIDVHSTPRQGSCFAVYLPAADSVAENMISDLEEPPIAGGTEQIMVVDDEPSICMALKEFLEDFGYQVTTCENGVTALKLFEQDPERFDLVFTDINMPGINGEKLANAMLDIRKDLPIILCTGYSEKTTEIRALAAGVRFFVQKPISNQKLDALIRTALDTPAGRPPVKSPGTDTEDH